MENLDKLVNGFTNKETAVVAVAIVELAYLEERKRLLKELNINNSKLVKISAITRLVHQLPLAEE